MKNQNYVCSDCGESTTKWSGKCMNCGAFNTLKEFREASIGKTKTKNKTGQDMLKQDGSGMKDHLLQRIETGISEVDRVLGGGFMPGGLVLFGGSPGVGKSTLALQIYGHCDNAIYFSGEESKHQIVTRGKRLFADKKFAEDKIVATNSIEDIITTVGVHKPDIIVVDSVQMITIGENGFGSQGQMRENVEVLLQLAKSSGVAIILIGHVTKADEIAGPRVLEHLVDVVLQLEGERNSEIRILRGKKNRFGSTLEIGVFEMEKNGLFPLANPSEFFLAERGNDAFGSCISVIREGVRNFLFEIQVLTTKTNFGLPRRTAHGVDVAKFHLVLAVVSKFTPFGCENFDAYLNVVGGWKIKDPAGDLAIAAAVMSSRMEQEIPADMVIMGELGLSGEVRSANNIEARLQEAAKLGFAKAVVPKIRKKIDIPKGITIHEVSHLRDMARVVFVKNT